MIKLILRFWWRLFVRKVLLAALLEQVRREQESSVSYTPDQRILAVQQRLSRYIGRSAAMHPRLRATIKEAVNGVA